MIDTNKVLKITRYAIDNEHLAPWVKCIWLLDADDAKFHYKLLPTDCIDVILNLESEMVYETELGKITAPPFHINGLRSKSSFIHQENKSRVFGISFYPYGLFPFVHKSMAGLQNNIINFSELSFDLEQKLSFAVSGNSSKEIVKSIEQALVNELFVSGSFLDKAKLIQKFLTVANAVSVQKFCGEWSINIKTFERMVLFYTGFTPKLLHDIKRFQIVSNQLSHQRINSLAQIAYDNNFTDQTHFIKNFKRYSGVTPGVFQSEKKTVKENVRYNYR